MTTYTAKSATELSSALNKVKAGDVVQISGNVGSVSLTAKHNGVSIQGSGTVNSMTITKASNIKVSGVLFKGNGTGLRVQESSGIDVSNCDFSGFKYGATFSKTSGLNVAGNKFSGLNEDAMRFAAITNGTISGNVYNEGNSKPAYSHKDFIQFWTSKVNGEGPSSNINITNNKFYGSDSYTHGIFFNNEANGPHHKGITITGNYINSGHTHGITLIGVDSSTISQNTLVKSGNGQHFPLINVTSDCQNITITNNTAPSVPSGNSTWTVSGNHETGGSGIKHYDNGSSGSKNKTTTSGTNTKAAKTKAEKKAAKKAAKKAVEKAAKADASKDKKVAKAAGVEANKEKAVSKAAPDDAFKFKGAPQKAVADTDHVSSAAASPVSKVAADKHAVVDVDLIADAHLATHKVGLDAHHADFLF